MGAVSIKVQVGRNIEDEDRGAMYKPFNAIYFFIMLFLLYGCATEEKYHLSDPGSLLGIQREMKVPGFWIGLNSEPDGIVMTPSEIWHFNEKLKKQLKVNHDILDLSDFQEEDLSEQLNRRLKETLDENLFLSSGKKPDEKFFRNIKENMAIDKAHPWRPRYGFTVAYSNQRVLPTDSILTQVPKDIDFDELQNNSLDIGTPLVILHTSEDGAWHYTMSAHSRGWIRSENIAVGGLSDIQRWLAPQPFVVVTYPKADIFQDEAMTQFHEYARMGSVFPFVESSVESEVICILMPSRQKDGTLKFRPAYVRTDQVHRGYLPYTPRIILQQAFLLLNAPYGWGGMYGEQDCSAFLQEIFATVGIDLPRNSAGQQKIGQLIGSFKRGPDPEKLQALSEQKGGTILIGSRGHITLYLGMHQGQPYIIHETGTYPGLNHMRHIVKRAVVSDLYRGEKSAEVSIVKISD